jgi:predicted ribosome quality control (RQC) complex YloA/Tae2 family protein
VTDLLADAAAELYQLDPDEFMARRQDLADQARAAGDPAAAKQITGLRKPTRSAWVVNRLVRADPDVTARLAALADELREAGRSPQGARIRELSAARSRLVDELTRQALSELPAPPAALREEVTATFDAALADPEVAANLGTLVRAAHWAGFGLNTGGSPAAPASSQKPAKPAPAEPAAERERRRREKIMEAERDVAEADRVLHAATAEEQQLEDTVRRLEAELAQARKQLAEARRQAYRAESRQRRASTALGRLRE